MTLIALAAAGRRIDPPDTPTNASRFPPSLEARVATEVRIALAMLKPRRVIASAACGADILIHEAARSLAMPHELVLPFSRQAFRERSVADRGERWGERFDALLSDPHTRVIQLRDNEPSDDLEADCAYAASTEALVRLAGGGGAGLRCVLLVWEGSRRGTHDQTADLADLAAALGWMRHDVSTRQPQRAMY